MTRDYQVGDRVHRVRGHPLGGYRPTGRRGTVTGLKTVTSLGYERLVGVRWDGADNCWGTYHPSVLEPLSAVELLAELGRDS